MGRNLNPNPAFSMILSIWFIFLSHVSSFLFLHFTCPTCATSFLSPPTCATSSLPLLPHTVTFLLLFSGAKTSLPSPTPNNKKQQTRSNNNYSKMGQLKLQCITSNPDQTTFYEFAYETPYTFHNSDGTAPSPKGSPEPLQAILVKSNSNPRGDEYLFCRWCLANGKVRVYC